LATLILDQKKEKWEFGEGYAFFNVHCKSS
jgi:hypothetical protein